MEILSMPTWLSIIVSVLSVIVIVRLSVLLSKGVGKS